MQTCCMVGGARNVKCRYAHLFIHHVSLVGDDDDDDFGGATWME